MARLTDKQKQSIIDSFNLGTSQNQLAKDFNVSVATINKYCKGKTPTLVNEVNSQVAINTTLSTQSEQQVNAFDTKVNDLTRKANLVYGVIENAIKRNADLLTNNKTYEKITVGDGVQQFEPRELNAMDIKNIVESTDKASITLKVNERHAPKNDINLNNANMQQTTNRIEIVMDD